MAKAARKSGRKRRKVKKTIAVPYVLSPGHKAVAVDDATINVQTDRIGTTFLLRFTRIESVPTGEKVKVETDGNLIRQIGDKKFIGGDLRKIVEADVLLRPDHAFAIANAIFDRLSKMEPDQITRYGLPTLKRIQEVVIKNAPSRKRRTKTKKRN